MIYGLSIGIVLCLLVSLMFFMIAIMESSMMGTEQDEVDAIINSKLNEYIDKTPGAKNASANKGSGAKAEMVGDSLKEIQIGMKLVPNMDQHNFLLRRMSLVGGDSSNYNGLESTIEYNTKAIGSDEGGNPNFYEWNGAESMNFPTMHLDSDHLPLGDSVGMCWGLSWIQVQKRN